MNCANRILVAVPLMLFCSMGLAFVDPISFTPALPRANEPVTMHFRAGVCHTFLPLTPDIVTVSGNVIDVIISGLQYTDINQCVQPTGDYHFTIGSFPAGQYTLNLRVMEAVPPFFVFPPARTAQLIVAPAGVVAPIDSLRVPGLTLLGALVAFCGFRRRAN